MKKLLLTLTAALLMPLLLQAATTGDVRYWSDGPLQWSDFHNATRVEGVPSYMKAYLALQSLQQDDTGATWLYGARAVMDREASFVDITVCDLPRLRYHQLQYDVLELYRRMLQRDINAGLSADATAARLKDYQRAADERMERIATATRGGADEQALAKEEGTVLAQLEQAGMPAEMVVAVSPVSYGAYAGIGAAFTTGRLHRLFAHSATFSLGLTAAWRSLRLKTDVAFGQPGFRRDNILGTPPLEQTDHQGNPLPAQGNTNSSATYIAVGFQLGYTIVNTRRLAITPNFGGAWSTYRWKVANYVYEDDPAVVPSGIKQGVASTEKVNIGGVNWMASVDFDIKLRTHATKSPFMLSGRRARLTQAVRVTPYIARTSYGKLTPAVTGFQAGFTISYVGLAELLQMR